MELPEYTDIAGGKRSYLVDKDIFEAVLEYLSWDHLVNHALWREDTPSETPPPEESVDVSDTIPFLTTTNP